MFKCQRLRTSGFRALAAPIGEQLPPPTRTSVAAHSRSEYWSTVLCASSFLPACACAAFSCAMIADPSYSAPSARWKQALSGGHRIARGRTVPQTSAPQLRHRQHRLHQCSGMVSTGRSTDAEAIAAASPGLARHVPRVGPRVGCEWGSLEACGAGQAEGGLEAVVRRKGDAHSYGALDEVEGEALEEPSHAVLQQQRQQCEESARCWSARGPERTCVTMRTRVAVIPWVL